MLIQITSIYNKKAISLNLKGQIIERHREKLNKKNNEISNLNLKSENFKKELEYSKINLNEYKAINWINKNF